MLRTLARHAAAVVLLAGGVLILVAGGALLGLGVGSAEILRTAGVGAMATLAAALVAALPGRERSRATLAVADSIGSMGTPGEAVSLLPVLVAGAPADLARAIEHFRKELMGALGRHRMARLKAEQSDLYETEFLATLSHELRTPLNRILGFSQVLIEEIDGDLSDGQREDAEAIQVSGEHLRGLVDEVLDLAAMQSARFDLRREPVEVRLFLTEIVRELAAQTQGRPIRIEARVPSEALWVDADPKRLRQILTNLATNALKFTETGSVVLEAREVPESVILSVRDTGVGIAAEDLDTIFGEFLQVGERRRTGRGAGLGLAITKRLTELHGGRVTAESDLGKGSVFHVSLPKRNEA